MNSEFYQRLSELNWKAPSDWVGIRTIDAHTEGEPLRVILAGFPELTGTTILERRRQAKEHYDNLRRSLMWEPRGHADMYGCLITPPVSETGDFGVLFLHNEGYSTMCGHGIIAVTKVAVEIGLIEPEGAETAVRIDTPAGLVTAYARMQNNSVRSVYFHNVPSFVLALDETVEVPGLGSIRYDLAFGGAFYAYVNAEDAGVRCVAEDYRLLIERGMAIKHTVMKNYDIHHPFEPDLNFLYGTIFIGPAEDPTNSSRNVCIFAEGEVDRCPTGTGVSARMAIHHARGEIAVGEKPMIIESLIGSNFKAGVLSETTFGSHKAVIPEVEGTAHITGIHQFVIDPEDPLRNGFILR
ncbi:MAG: proline racemase family protein [Calditrichia bacterium]